jgi:hypothetical protein
VAEVVVSVVGVVSVVRIVRTSVSSAEAIAAAGESRGYSGPSSGKTSRKIGERTAAPPIPHSWQLVATAMAAGSMNA